MHCRTRSSHTADSNDETLVVGGSKTLRHSTQDVITLVAAGITVREALLAHAAS
jgi:transketolase C-terminal domain/subunit